MANSQNPIGNVIELEEGEENSGLINVTPKVKTAKASSPNNSDKPYILVQGRSSDLGDAVRKCSGNVLHNIHVNGRNMSDLTSYTRNNLLKNIAIIPITSPDLGEAQQEVQVAVQLMERWSKAVFQFSQGKALEAGKLIFFRCNKDVKRIYLPCCNDVKIFTAPTAKALRNHFMECITARTVGDTCAFCNSTNLETGASKDSKTKDAHYASDNHMNALYQVLCIGEKGMQMADARVLDLYITDRPMFNFFFRGEARTETIATFLDFMSTHFTTAYRENTPFYRGLVKMVRMAKNAGKNKITLLCPDCDTAFTAFSVYYLGTLLDGTKVNCICGNTNAREVGVDQIESLFSRLSDMRKKQAKFTAADINRFFDNIRIDVADNEAKMEVDLDQLLLDIKKKKEVVVAVPQQKPVALVEAKHVVREAKRVVEANDAALQRAQMAIRSANRAAVSMEVGVDLKRSNTSTTSPDVSPKRLAIEAVSPANIVTGDKKEQEEQLVKKQNKPKEAAQNNTIIREIDKVQGKVKDKNKGEPPDDGYKEAITTSETPETTDVQVKAGNLIRENYKAKRLTSFPTVSNLGAFIKRLEPGLTKPSVTGFLKLNNWQNDIPLGQVALVDTTSYAEQAAAFEALLPHLGAEINKKINIILADMIIKYKVPVDMQDYITIVAYIQGYADYKKKEQQFLRSTAQK